MATSLDWRDIALRLGLTVVAGALIGFNREERGRSAGLRTTLLVCLAASVAMLQTNLLLPTAGRANDSFVTLDLMRLPLGILSGVGFLGAGAIIRRPDLIVGVTTAAILWISTVIGLCFGGGQIALGIVATVLGLLILWALKWPERYIRQDRRATLIMLISTGGPSTDEVLGLLKAGGYAVVNEAVTYREQAKSCELRYEVQWRASRVDSHLPELLSGLAGREGVLELKWNPQGFTER